MHRRPTIVDDLYDDAHVEQDYYQEIEALVREATGASQVVIFDHTRRRDDGGSSGSGSTSFSVTDAPVDDVEIVKVTFSRIDLKPADDDAEVLSYEFDEPVTIDNLLALTGNDAEPILEGVDVPPGDYQWLRVYVCLLYTSPSPRDRG